MTRPTVPAVSAEAQAARGWPRPGTRVRVTRTHTSGLVETTEGVAADGGWDEDRTTYWLLLNEGAGEVALTSDDVWTVTWEELEPAPSPVLPPISEPDEGAVVLDADKDLWRRFGDGNWNCLTDSPIDWTWASLHKQYGPLVELRPVSEVVDRADAQELAEALRPFAARVCSCFDQPCIHEAARTALARFDAPGVTA